MAFRRFEHTDFTIIRLDEPTDFCCVCNQEVYMDYGLAMYEGDIVPNDWKGEWGGFTACRRCYELFTTVTVPISVREARKQISG